MRLETIEKEAKTFDREGECYIHIERISGKPFIQTVAGDPPVIAQAIYQLMCSFCKDTGRTFKELLRFLKFVNRKYGASEEDSIHEIE